MQVVKVCSMPHDFQKFPKRGTPLRPAGFVRCQIAGHNMRRSWSQRSEIIPAAQIGRRINLFRRRKKPASKIWVAEIFVNRASAVTAITVSHCIDQIAAQSYQFPVFSLKIEWNRGDGESLLDAVRLIVAVALIALIALVAAIALVTLVA